ncbi:hypothetical protein MHC_00685 [Mycoplasma haemocanis str. Illinois]|uniref:Uncharacterized protein n=1 Tax=Mycoplasma haemocanis (strain Illinois) TaxID=1111676 RepID=H6N5P3_MYCHN|nr:hypothetical protein [Mycoplasma haemocanis]AEW45003.2 hypothetical protein MHC_00685 [Mycoplasma haemocanis str. Illinois]
MKYLLLAGGIGSIGVVTYGGYLAFKNKDFHAETILSIWQVVSSKKERFILSTDTTSHDTEWDEISKNLSNKEDVKSSLGVATITKDSLKNWCSKAKVENAEEGLLENYESWCTKNSNFGQLAALKKVILEEGDSKWDENVTNYSQSGKPKLIDESGQEKSESLKDKGELMSWCNKNLRSLYKKDSPSTKAYMEWCVKDANDSSSPEG